MQLLSFALYLQVQMVGYHLGFGSNSKHVCDYLEEARIEHGPLFDCSPTVARASGGIPSKSQNLFKPFAQAKNAEARPR